MRPGKEPSIFNTRFFHVGIEELLCIFVLAFFAMQGAIPGIAPNEATEMTHTAATTLMKVVGIGSQILINAVICILAVQHLQRLRRFVFALQWTAAIAVFAVCSTLWSQDPMTTARRSIPFALAMIFGLYLVSRFRISEQISILTATMTVAALATVALALFAPSIGLEASSGHHGDWQGIFTQKNACGRAMVFASAALLSSGRVSIARITTLLLFLLVLIMSGSRGAWLIEAVVLLCCGLLHVLARYAPYSRAVLLYSSMFVVIAVSVAVWIYFPPVAGFLGRDATLTGRTAIWHQVWIAIEKRPLLGYGFAAFWQGMKGESYNIIVALRFVVFHAHNGFFELWLELGAAGLLLFALSYLRAWRKLWQVMRAGETAGTSWMAIFLLLILLYNLDENTLLTFNGLFWVLYVITVADIEILAREHRMRYLKPMRPVETSNYIPVHVMVRG
jgi:O-antigen ligase